MAKDSYLLTEMLQPVPEGHGNLIMSSGSIPAEYTKHYVSIGMYDDHLGQEYFQATAGTAVVQVTDDGNQYGHVTNGTVDMTKPDYPRPNWCGRTAAVKVSMVGITPESGYSSHYFIKVCIHSYKD